MVKKYFIGIDISNKRLDVSVYGHNVKAMFDPFTVANDLEGMNEMIQELGEYNIDVKQCWFCYEHTGNYGILLSCFLQQKGICYSVIPAIEIKLSKGMTRGKSDPADARAIAIYAVTHREKLHPTTLPEPIVLKIKEWLSYRDMLVRTKVKFVNSLKSRQKLAEVISIDDILEDITARIKELGEKISSLDATIDQEINKSEPLQKNYGLLKSVTGIGPLIAAFMIVSTNNFDSFDNARKYSCYTGIAPFEHTSGSSIKGKTKVSQLGNKQIKTLLYNGANSAVRFDTELNRYYQRKKKEGKHHQSIINAVACKIVGRAFAVVKRGTPYVKTYDKNFVLS